MYRQISGQSSLVSALMGGTIALCPTGCAEVSLPDNGEASLEVSASQPADSSACTTGGTVQVLPSHEPAAKCPRLRLKEDTTVKGQSVDQFTWRDASGLERTASMARVGGGYVRQFTYRYDGNKTRTVSGTDGTYGVGFGYLVNHVGEGTKGEMLTSASGSENTHMDASGTFRPVFVGAHHAIYEYKPVITVVASHMNVTQHWFFATGRDHPVMAVTYDLTGAPEDHYELDTRTPYGDVAWDGDENQFNTVVSGVAWGDRYRFKTTKAPLTMNSTWTYTEQNLVPYHMVWADASDAEMGLVQTQTWEQNDAGGYGFYWNWGRTSETQSETYRGMYVMPVNWNWTYQSNQWQICPEDESTCDPDAPTGSHRLAWGTNYGAVGLREYDAYGDDRILSGYPYQSYGVFVVLGKHTANAVLSQVGEIETVQRTTLAASVGKVKVTGPGGVGRTDEVAFNPPGYDHRYSTWNIDAVDNQIDLTVRVNDGVLHNPVLVVWNYTKPSLPTIFVNGVPAKADAGVLASLDTKNKKLWLTFRPGFGANTRVAIRCAHPTIHVVTR